MASGVNDAIMESGDLRSVLRLVKAGKTKVGSAVGLSDDGSGIILVDKRARPKSLLKKLKQNAIAAKVELNVSSLRYGYAFTEDNDPTTLRFNLNKNAAPALGIKLKRVVKPFGFNNVVLVIDDKLELEEEGELGGDEATSGEPLSNGATAKPGQEIPKPSIPPNDPKLQKLKEGFDKAKEALGQLAREFGTHPQALPLLTAAAKDLKLAGDALAKDNMAFGANFLRSALEVIQKIQALRPNPTSAKPVPGQDAPGTQGGETSSQQTGSGTSTGNSETVSPTKNAPPAEDVGQRLKDVAQRLKDVKVQEALKNQGVAADVARLYREAMTASGGQDPARALSLLLAAERIMDEALGAPSEDEVAEVNAKRFDDLKNTVGKALDDLVEQQERTEDPKRKTRMSELLKPLQVLMKKAIQQGDERKFGNGIRSLQHLQSLATNVFGRLDWEESIVLSNYQLSDDEGGRGGFGATHFLKPVDEQVGGPNLIFKTPNAENRLGSFESEAAVYERLGDHPNIARCLGMREIAGQKGLLMEAIEGGTAQSTIGSFKKAYLKGDISHEAYWSVIQSTVEKILSGLAHMEDMGIVHADIKPENLMFDGETGQLKIIDMGISLESGTSTRTYSGGFSSPEQVSSKNLDGKADVYSLGATLYGLVESKGGFGMYADGLSRDNVEKKTGVYARETEYTNFINLLVDPDPKKRLSLREALEHPFLRDRPLGNEQVQELITGARFSKAVTIGSGKWPSMRNLLISRGISEQTVDRMSELGLAVTSLKTKNMREYKDVYHKRERENSEKCDALQLEIEKLSELRNFTKREDPKWDELDRQISKMEEEKDELFYLDDDADTELLTLKSRLLEPILLAAKAFRSFVAEHVSDSEDKQVTNFLQSLLGLEEYSEDPKSAGEGW